MSKEINKVDINKHEIDIGTLFKQNVNDLSAIKELYKKLQDIENKISQIKYIDSKLADKLKKDYEKLKKLILDENIQEKLSNDIETIKTELTSVLNTIQDVMYNDYMKGMEFNWVNQHISTTTGGGSRSTIGIRCADFPAGMALLLLVTNSSNYIFRIAEYTSSWEFVKMLVTDERIDRYVFEKDRYYRFSVMKADKSVLTDDERTLIKQSITIKKLRLTDDEILNEISNTNLTYTGLSPYLLNRLSYTPFCNSYIPKIGFVDDDGYETVLTTTVPLFESKNLPLTIACWSTSHVFDDTANKSNLIAKLGNKLEIAQHTRASMTGKTEEELRAYFDEQLGFWNTNNVTVNAMVYGYNNHDAMLRCVVSDYFKLACQGTNATLSNNTNRYALNRIRVQTATNLGAYKGYVDKAITNKESLIFFWHSNEISDNVELYNCLSELLDYVITKTSQITPVLLSNLI